jgi:lysophospholipase L1-like esterase
VTETSFDYSNLSGRSVAPLVRVAGGVLPGIRRVQRHVAPYAAAWEANNARALAQSDGPVWFALGDSMTQGIGASAYDRGWLGQLAAELPTPYRIVNLSFNGARVADVLDRQLPALESLRARGVTSDLVTVMIGSNDLISRRWTKALPELTEQMLERLPTGSVVANQPGVARPAVRRFNGLIEQYVEQRGLVLADFRDPRMRSWRGKLAADHFHPNDRGYASMAEIMREAIAD